jgi:hypothetical protein
MLKRYVDEDEGEGPLLKPMSSRRYDDLGQMSLTVVDEPALDADEDLGCQGLVIAEQPDEHDPGWLGLLSG